MRKNNLILIAAIVAVVALVIGIPTFMTGCGGDDSAGDNGRIAQQIQDRDGNCDGGSECFGQEGRGMGREGRVQGADCEEGDCLGSDCDGDCEGSAAGDCDGLGSTDDEPFGSEPICF